ncbi:ribosome biogenesis GTPase Der [Kiritimatiella glycovorans]|uniref:GTPase Der n=1 Tax=Kiritimatiella glycovorans TaxID=1307763 RepID=A0A0G3EJF5_9BACT|nr:ribosome biogenesis GTPase Der [Kiritimatiella glycovorans]AKJ65572.1 GTP-binding protein EngA [Kiritimatiella glycovorans]
MNNQTTEQQHDGAAPARNTVAIVGRPNVGKSAIFNRLAGRRIAIVHEMSGVTRDRLACEISWEGRRFELIDTGGLERVDAARNRDEIASGIHHQVQVAIEDAAVIVLVVDLTVAVAPLDEEVASLLRRSGRPVVVAANKADDPRRDDWAAEYERLGFHVYPVSALHGRGLYDLMEEVTASLPDIPSREEEEALRVTVAGRPNAGKSSYLNRILEDERLIVSEVPGTTRDAIEVPFTIGDGAGARRYRLIDTAGVRNPKRRRDAVEMFGWMRTAESIRRADVVVLLMDATEGPRKQDKRIAAEAIEARKGILVLVNKWDLAEGTEVTRESYAAEVKKAVPFLDFAPLLFVSALTGAEVRESLDAIDYVAAQVETQITTGVLNRVIRDAVERNAPPASGNRRLKIFYAVQTGTRPVRIRFFVNDPKLVGHGYRQYLTNRLRAAFGLEGAPVVLQFSARTRE